MQLAATNRLAIFIAAAIVFAIALAIAYGPIGSTFEHAVSTWLNVYAKRINPAALSGPRLYVVAFAGGLLASISPCILGLLPVNLSYIGASRVTSRAAALRVSTFFVCGVATTTIAVGLLSWLFFAIFVTYRAQVNIGVGLLIVLMALWMAGVLRIPLPSVVTKVPAGAGPFVVGLVYALISTPCASPVLIAVLSAAGGTGSAVVSIITMATYAIGYTIVLWLASVFTAVAIASRKLLQYGDLITRIGAAALLLLGSGFIVYGAGQL